MFSKQHMNNLFENIYKKNNKTEFFKDYKKFRFQAAIGHCGVVKASTTRQPSVACDNSTLTFQKARDEMKLRTHPTPITTFSGLLCASKENFLIVRDRISQEKFLHY